MTNSFERGSKAVRQTHVSGPNPEGHPEIDAAKGTIEIRIRDIEAGHDVIRDGQLLKIESKVREGNGEYKVTFSDRSFCYLEADDFLEVPLPS